MSSTNKIYCDSNEIEILPSRQYSRKESYGGGGEKKRARVLSHRVLATVDDFPELKPAVYFKGVYASRQFPLYLPNRYEKQSVIDINFGCSGEGRASPSPPRAATRSPFGFFQSYRVNASSSSSSVKSANENNAAQYIMCTYTRDIVAVVCACRMFFSLFVFLSNFRYPICARPVGRAGGGLLLRIPCGYVENTIAASILLARCAYYNMRHRADASFRAFVLRAADSHAYKTTADRERSERQPI